MLMERSHSSLSHSFTLSPFIKSLQHCSKVGRKPLRVGQYLKTLGLQSPHYQRNNRLLMLDSPLCWQHCIVKGSDRKFCKVQSCRLSFLWNYIWAKCEGKINPIAHWKSLCFPLIKKNDTYIDRQIWRGCVHTIESMSRRTFNHSPCWSKPRASASKSSETEELKNVRPFFFCEDVSIVASE